MIIAKWDNAVNYSMQTEIITQALGTSTHSLDTLLDLMRRTGQIATYFSGTRLDNDFCFGSYDVGVLLSVLPEDGSKAAEPGYHPGSSEIYVTFRGTLILERLLNGQVHEETVGPHGVLVLAPGVCHRVRYDSQREASSIIVKPNLAFKPGVVRCASCTYYNDETQCALNQRWKAEMRG